MASLGMGGPYQFTSSEIDRVVTKTSPGNYALGQMNEQNTFIVRYVGRSDTNLNQELKARLPTGLPQFKFSYAASPKAAFEKECQNYHDFGESESLNNEIHPDRPDNTNWVCPSCTIFSEN